MSTAWSSQCVPFDLSLRAFTPYCKPSWSWQHHQLAHVKAALAGELNRQPPLRPHEATYTRLDQIK